MDRVSLCLVLMWTWCSPGFAADANRPNIVLIVADDLGYADVPFNPQHGKEIALPNLDSLAKNSVICRQGYVTGNVCSPTPIALESGPKLKSRT